MKKTLTTVLLFAGMASAWASDLPDGDYKASCKDIKMVGTSLRATCNNGWMRWTAIPEMIPANLDNANTCAFVQNLNGRLTCWRQK